MPSLAKYFSLLKRNEAPFRCPHCDQTVSSESFEGHCLEKHELDSASHCVWCFGNAVWSGDDKGDRVSHLSDCYRSFLASHVASRDPAPASPGEPTPLDTTCDVQEYAHRRPPGDLQGGNVFVVVPPPSGLTYSCPGLDLAVACLRLYLTGAGHADWYRVAVREHAFPGFLAALEADAGATYTLPFSCFCDGGGSPHRHFVVASSPRGHFARTFWKRIRCPRKATGVRKSPVATALDLVDALGEVSRPRRTCAFESGKAAASPVVLNYCATVPLPRLYELVLVLQWDGGVAELIRREHADDRPHLLVPGARSFGGLWGVRVADLPNIWTNVVLPVEKPWFPCERVTDTYVHLAGGRKLYFEWREDLLGDDWTRRQAERGNLFCEAVGDDVYYPTPYQQRCLDVIKPQADRIAELEWTLERSETELDEVETSARKLRVANRSLKRKLGESERELKTFHLKHIVYLERENERLRKERGGGTKLFRGERSSL